MIKMVVSDVDGTLINEDKKTICQRNKEAIQRCRESGVHFVIASGRGYTGVVPYAQELGLNDVRHVCDNGAAVVDTQGNKEVLAEIDDASYHQLLDRIRQLPCEILVVNDQGGYYEDYEKNKHIIQPSQEAFVSLPFQQANLYDITNVTKVVVGFEQKDLPALKAATPDTMDCMVCAPQAMDYTPKGVDKAKGIAFLAKEMGISMDEILTVGDAGNDIAMIRAAHIGFAVANASDSLKKRCDVVLPVTNEEGAVGFLIEKYVLEEYNKQSETA